MSTVVDIAGLEPPANERQARELAPLLGEGEQAVVEVWRELRDEYGMEVAAPLIRALVLDWRDRKMRSRPRTFTPRGQKVQLTTRGREVRLASAGATRVWYVLEGLDEVAELLVKTDPRDRAAFAAAENELHLLLEVIADAIAGLRGSEG